MSASREKRLRRELREAEENSGIIKKEKKVKKYRTPAQARRLKNFILSTIAIVLVAVFALLIIVNCGVVQKNGTALTVGDHKVTPAEFNYFYQDSYYNAYSTYSSLWSYLVDTSLPVASQTCYMAEEDMTWGEYIADTAAETAKQVYALYDAAQEAGFVLPQETADSIAAMPETLASYAESAGLKDADAYLEASYGKGCDVENYLQYLTIQQTAAAYAQEKGESFSYDDSALRTYYDSKKQDFDTVSYRLFSVATEDDDSAAAKKTADDMAAKLDGSEQSFIDAALEAAPEDSKEYYADSTATLRSYQSYSYISSDYADWLFSAERIEGESQVFATSTGYAVVMFVSRNNNEYKTVDVRHILVQVGATAEDGTSTDSDWETCLAAAEELRAEWEATDMTEDAFAALATEKTEDTGSASNGGLYEDIAKGEMVTEFEDWCFDEVRVPGDTGLIKTDYGYHLMYYVGTGDEYWKTVADTSLRNEDYNAWYEEFSAAYEPKTSTVGQWFTNKYLPALTTQ